jgi:sugar phosphate isomerase/epimerase
MEIGILTAPFRNESLDHVIDFASANGFDALEIAATPGSRHLDPATLTARQAKEIAAKVEKKGLRISSLACYMNVTDPDPGKRQAVVNHLIKAVDAAHALGIDVVCAMAGMPQPGMTRIETIEKVVSKVYPKILRHAARKGVKIAMENWTATNIRNLQEWDRIFEVVPDENFGLNFDPSHLYWQGIDPIEAVDRFAKRIFHVHAKDTEVKAHKLRYVGNQGSGWWRYVIPGLGDIAWGPFIGALRRIGYNSVLSIEHEDGAQGREEGFIRGMNYLRQFA